MINKKYKKLINFFKRKEKRRLYFRLCDGWQSKRGHVLNIVICSKLIQIIQIDQLISFNKYLWCHTTEKFYNVNILIFKCIFFSFTLLLKVIDIFILDLCILDMRKICSKRYMEFSDISNKGKVMLTHKKGLLKIKYNLSSVRKWIMLRF